VNDHSHFIADDADIIDANTSAKPEDFRLLRRLKLPERLNDAGETVTRRALYLDVESTGLRIGVDEVIELAMLPFDYEPDTGRITDIHHAEAFNALSEPSIPITPEASAVNGITAQDVAGKEIDDDAVDALARSVSLIVAHNAGFDRPMVESRWPVFSELPWACSLKDVNWRGEGFSGQSLEYLGMKFGWFFDGHRALADCEAGVALLGETLPATEVRVMQAMREHALAKTYRIPATRAPFEKKDVLKERGYRWDAANKVWWTEVRELDEELGWLEESVFGKPTNLDVETITAKNRYSANSG